MLWYSGRERQLGIVVLIAGLALDGYALSSAAFGEQTLTQRWLIFLSGHTLASLLVAPALWYLLPAHLRRQAVAGVGLFFSLCFYVPLMGALGLFAAVVVTAYHPRRIKPEWLRTLAPPTLPERPPGGVSEVRRNVTGLMGVLENAREPELRMRALLATRQMEDRDAVPLLRVALTDTVDEVRLMAYAMLDAMEQRLNERIQVLRGELDEAHAADAGRLHQEIAEALWELAYLGLAQGEVLEHVLGNAHEHLDRNLHDDRRHPHGWFLMGRIRLARGDLDGAEQAFALAVAHGFPEARVNPHRAEVAFQRGRFADMRDLLGEVREATCESVVLAPVEDAA